MRKLILAIMISVMMLFTGIATAEMFVYDSGTDVTVSWVPVTSAFYYNLTVTDKSDNTTSTTELTFDTQIVVNGLTKHNIYNIKGNAYDLNGTLLESMGDKYICFAVDDSSGTCICNCPEISNHVYYGTIGNGWYTGVAICNSTPERQVVLLHINDVTNAINVSSYSCHTEMLGSILDIDEEELDRSESYAITMDAVAGVDITLYIANSISFSMQ